jgi:hypothetical protein
MIPTRFSSRILARREKENEKLKAEYEQACRIGKKKGQAVKDESYCEEEQLPCIILHIHLPEEAAALEEAAVREEVAAALKEAAVQEEEAAALEEAEVRGEAAAALNEAEWEEAAATLEEAGATLETAAAAREEAAAQEEAAAEKAVEPCMEISTQDEVGTSSNTQVKQDRFMGYFKALGLVKARSRVLECFSSDEESDCEEAATWEAAREEAATLEAAREAALEEAATLEAAQKEAAVLEVAREAAQEAAALEAARELAQKEAAAREAVREEAAALEAVQEAALEATQETAPEDPVECNVAGTQEEGVKKKKRVTWKDMVNGAKRDEDNAMRRARPIYFSPSSIDIQRKKAMTAAIDKTFQSVDWEAWDNLNMAPMPRKRKIEAVAQGAGCAQQKKKRWVTPKNNYFLLTA